MTILLVVAIFVFLIVAHEFGHFLFAKIFGVRVEEFGVGYPPRAFLFGTFGGTEYTLNWIPFGGFVRLFGEDANDANGPGSFVRAPRSRQALILIAGVLFNALAAWLLFSGSLMLGVPRLVDHADPGENVKVIVSDVVAGSPAAAAGIAPGDEIRSMDAPDGSVPLTLAPDSIVKFVSAHGGQALRIVYMHAGTTTSATIRPANAVVPGALGRPALGVGLALVSYQSLSLLPALVGGFWMTWHALAYVCASMWTLLAGAVRGHANISEVVGPVGLVSVIGAAARNGVGYVLELAAFISINLAVVNLIPIPALDGGRLLIVGIEALRRKPTSALFVQVLNTVGIALIVILMVTVTYHDIARLLQ